jgi:hypothetical protein
MSHRLYREKESGIFKTNSPESLGTLAKIIDFLIFFIFFLPRTRTENFGP